eukprot:CAMPEP_0185746544 /NCGR_PEP_ID=MMETSP1174-20130828/5127_1 /TAXON_ID=35687 /ORGANISM="Dictyocha speculum, Strain CCMP1381" /LENGTH=176 /DNA_ID=CAMNT_0028421307 /DNA_START=237 /DNA_END=767 /DNA_ORIENTATION=-
MGSGASTPIPDAMSKDECKAITGEHFNEEKWNESNTDGSITKEKLSELGFKGEQTTAEQAPSAETSEPAQPKEEAVATPEPVVEVSETPATDVAVAAPSEAAPSSEVSEAVSSEPAPTSEEEKVEDATPAPAVSKPEETETPAPVEEQVPAEKPAAIIPTDVLAGIPPSSAAPIAA